jgi:hypothetical protein
MALYIVDYPFHLLLRPLIDGSEYVGTYLVAILVLGGVFWFIVGSIVTYIIRAAVDAARC